MACNLEITSRRSPIYPDTLSSLPFIRLFIKGSNQLCRFVSFGYLNTSTVLPMPQTTLSHTFSPAHITALNQTLKSPQNPVHLTRLLKYHRLLLRWQQDGDDSTLGKLWRAYCRADVDDF